MTVQARSFVKQAIEVEEAFGVAVGGVWVFCDDLVAADRGRHADCG